MSVREEVEFGGLVSVEINFYGLRVQIVLLSNSTGIWHVRSDQQQKKFSLESMMLMNTLRSPWSLVKKQMCFHLYFDTKCISGTLLS